MQNTTLPSGAIAGPIQHQEPISQWNGIAIIGEAPGRTEIINKEPFSGPAGQLLDNILKAVGIIRQNTLITNAFLHQPAWSSSEEGKRRNNDIMNFFTHDPSIANKKLPTYRGSYVKEDICEDIRTTWRLIKKYKPKLIVCMGNTALWAITHLDGINQNRGKLLKTNASDCPVFATFHPAYVLHRRDNSLIRYIEQDIKSALAAIT